MDRADLDLSPARDRVREHTPYRVNAKLDTRARERLVAAERGGTRGLLRRVGELDREWDVDRALMANFAIVGGTTFALGVATMRGRRGAWNGWLTFFTIQLAFLLNHAAVGWCPPLPVFRRLGYRTQKEIARERRVLLDRLRSAARDAAGVRSPDVQ